MDTGKLIKIFGACVGLVTLWIFIIFAINVSIDLNEKYKKIAKQAAVIEVEANSWLNECGTTTSSQRCYDYFHSKLVE